MAENKDESQEKTQEPSSRKLEKAKEQGNVLNSKETFVFTVMCAGVVLMYGTPFLVNDFLFSLRTFFMFGPEVKYGHSALSSIGKAIKIFITVTIVFGVPLMVVTILTQLAVGGLNWSFQALEVKLSKMSPIKGLKKMFGVKSLIELSKGLLKVFVLGTIAFFLIKDFMPDITHLTTSNLASAVARLVSFFPILLFGLLIGLAIIAIIDYSYAKYSYIKELKMSHQDIKDEYKETDGQPEVKVKIRKLQIEASRKAGEENASADPENLSNATAIITNPTHFAIALKYEVGESSAPKIIAKGRGRTAEKIILEAKKLNIGNLQSPLLARALYYTGEIGGEVMSQLYNAVAIALAYIYKINEGETIEKPEIEVPEELIFDEFGNKNDK